MNITGILNNINAHQPQQSKGLTAGKIDNKPASSVLQRKQFDSFYPDVQDQTGYIHEDNVKDEKVGEISRWQDLYSGTVHAKILQGRYYFAEGVARLIDYLLNHFRNALI